MQINLLLLSVFLSIIIYANTNHINGISGVTLKDGGTGCECHWYQANDSVAVWIEGPDSVYTNDSAHFKIYIKGGPAIVGGFDLAVFYGTLISVDSLTYTISGELTHTMPNTFVNDTVVWEFKYFAPHSVLVDTLYATGNSCNGDSIPTEIDQWNHAENFIVNVVDEPVYVEDRSLQPDEFVLYQNYPNPFNPSTKIRFRIPLLGGDERGGFVTLKVYDILGNEIATLINEYKPAGEYEVEFNVGRESIPATTSGVYFYQLRIGEFIQTKKMLLIK